MTERSLSLNGSTDGVPNSPSQRRSAMMAQMRDKKTMLAKKSLSGLELGVRVRVLNLNGPGPC
jgi:hypothetical protein